MPSREELLEIYNKLSAPFPPEAIERTRASETRRGYDTAGIKAQYILNRLNEAVGLGAFRVERQFAVRERQTRSGGVMFDATCEVRMQLGQWVDGTFVAFAEAQATGGHAAASDADARKGAASNGIKKCAAMFGCGWQAYAGIIDDDNLPLPEAQSQSPPRRRGAPQAGQPQAPASSNSDREPAPRGRVTAGQLARMRDLVAKVGGEWSRFREHIRTQRGINPEFLSTAAADEVIKELMAMAKRPRGTGATTPSRVA